MKFYSIGTDGSNIYHTKEIINPKELPDILKEYEKYPSWNLSITDKGKLNVNPAIPLYIYGDIKTDIIINESKAIIYSRWTGEHKQSIEARYLDNAVLSPFPRGINEGTAVEVCIYNSQLRQTEWKPGTFIDYQTATDCDYRIGVNIGGKILTGNSSAHPYCVRLQNQQTINK